MHISSLRESNYLQKHDVDPPVLVTIKGNPKQENLAMEGKPEELKWVLFFEEFEKGLVLNSTNGQLIAMALGSEDTEDWDGKQIVLYNDPNVSFQGKLVGGIRVRKSKANAKGQGQQPIDADDEIPF